MDTIAFFDDSSDDDSLDIRLERRVLRYKSEDVLQMNDRDFQKNVRLNKAAFKYILSELESASSESGRQGSLSAKDKLSACLRVFAEGSYQHSVGKDFNINIAQSTFCKVLDEFLNKLEHLLCSKWISMSMNGDEERIAKMTFYEKCGIPNVTMAVDGTHVKIIAPNCDKHLFYNRKGYFSINVMIVIKSFLSKSAQHFSNISKMYYRYVITIFLFYSCKNI